MTTPLPKPTGPLLARRNLDLHDKNGIFLSLVEIKIYKPLCWGRKGSWICYYEILGLGTVKLRHAAGADAIQAMLLTFVNIGTHLYASKEAKAGRLKLNGDGNLGFPTFSDEFMGNYPEAILKLYL